LEGRVAREWPAPAAGKESGVTGAIRPVNAGRDIRRSNAALVLGQILRSGPISVREISETVGLSKVTTHAILDELGGRDLIEVARHDHARRGPAAALYAARADAAYAVSASADAQAAVAECVDLLGVSRARARVPGAEPIDGVVRAIREVSPAGAPTIVVGLPYSLAGDAGRLTRELGRPVDVRSNLELACRIEAAAQEANTFVYASLGPEPAVAAVAAGRTYTGPTSLLTRRTLADVVATTCAVFEAPLVVGDLGDLPIAGRPRRVASRAGADAAARGARVLAVSRMRESLIGHYETGTSKPTR
jgi:MarR family